MCVCLVTANEKKSTLPLNNPNPLTAMFTGSKDKVTPQQALMQTMAATHAKVQAFIALSKQLSLNLCFFVARAMLSNASAAHIWSLSTLSYPTSAVLPLVRNGAKCQAYIHQFFADLPYHVLTA